MSDTPANPPEGRERNQFRDSTLPEGREPTSQQQGDALEFNDSSPEDNNSPTTQPDDESIIPMGSQPTKEASGEEGKTTMSEESDGEDAGSQPEEESDEQENHENDENQEVGDDNTQIKQSKARNRHHNVDDDFLSTDDRYMGPIALGLINRFFLEQDADRRAGRASAAERNDWESAISVSEDTSQSQDPEENREDGETEEDGASEQEEENLHDWEEDSGGNQNRGDNQDEEENEGNQDDGENRDDAEDAESSTDNSSVNSGASSSSQVPVEDQVLPKIEEAISDSDSGSSSISVPENLPSFPTSSPTPESPGPTPHLVAPDQVSWELPLTLNPFLSPSGLVLQILIQQQHLLQPQLPIKLMTHRFSIILWVSKHSSNQVPLERS